MAKRSIRTKKKLKKSRREKRLTETFSPATRISGQSAGKTPSVPLSAKERELMEYDGI
jgi:hypothetical protein